MEKLQEYNYRSLSLLKLSLISLLFLSVFFPTYWHLYRRFIEPDSYYSHGFLIPFISLYLVWRKRQILKNLRLAPLNWGIFVLLSGLFLHVSCTALKLNFGSYLSIIVTLIGLILYLGGKKLLKELIFPIGFLLFMMPLPAVVIIGISFKMKILAAHIATVLVKAMGLNVVRQGSTVYLPEGFLVIGDPCSGLRSLISFFALGVLFTQFCQATKLKKIILVIMTLPMALVSNVIRIMALIIVAYIYGEKTALGFFHDFMGMMVFVLGFIGFILVAKLLRCRLTTEII